VPTPSSAIADRVLEAILAQRLPPGMRLGEQQLATIFAVSRTLVREALTRLSERGVVTVNARRGWYVLQPSLDEAREAFAARRVIELGMLREAKAVDAPALRRLKAHITRERAAVRGQDIGARSFLLGDFHVCLAECIGNALLADMLRDLTARTTLIAMLYQSTHDATHSCDEHVEIVAALQAGDSKRAESLMAAHIGHVQAGLQRGPTIDALAQLRDALAPVAKGEAPTLQSRIPTPAAAQRAPSRAPAAPRVATPRARAAPRSTR
jgi:DNA-binding GntR family transcriptional regulator